jgi:hypothetical protein
MIPLVPLSPAKSSRLTGTQAVNAKTISENEPPHQRSTHNGAIWSMEVKDDTYVESWSVEQNDWIATCVILKTREKKQDN